MSLIPEKIFNSESEGDSALLEVFLTDGEVQESDDLIWKDILREGEWAYRPGPGQKAVPVPLKIVPGKANVKEKEIGMEDILEAFEDGAIDHVTVPTSHDDKPHENAGYVRDLKIVERDGKTFLRAGIEFTELDIKGRVTRKSIAGVSAGIVFDYVKKDSGKRYKMALGHVALTNKPWINGMVPFSEDFSDEQIASVSFADIVWDQEQSFNWIRNQISNSIRPYVEPDMECYVNDVSNDQALVTKFDSSGNEFNYVVPFKINNGSVAIEDKDNWIEAKREWVKTSETLNQKSFAEIFRKEKEETLSESARKGADQNKPNEGEMGMSKEVEEKKDSTKEPGATPSPDPAPATELSEKERNKIKEELSVEFSEKLKKEAEEKKELQEKVHKMTVESRVAELEDDFKDHPGILKEVRNLMLADVAGEKVLSLSEQAEGESEAKEVELSLTEAIERIISVLPKKDGKINFGEQTNETENHNEPKSEVDETKSVEERAAEFAQDLGLTDYPVPEKKDGDA